MYRKNKQTWGLILSAVSGIPWGSWNVSTTDQGQLLHEEVNSEWTDIWPISFILESDTRVQCISLEWCTLYQLSPLSTFQNPVRTALNRVFVSIRTTVSSPLPFHAYLPTKFRNFTSVKDNFKLLWTLFGTFNY